MSSRGLVWDSDGNCQGEIVANFKRSWKWNNYGEATFTLSEDDALTHNGLIQFGRYLTIEHNKLDIWGGMIDPNRDWGFHQFTVTAYSGEYILKNKRTPKNAKSEDDGGEIFKDLIHQVKGCHILRIGSLYRGGGNHVLESHWDNIYESVKSMAEECGTEWCVVPSIVDHKLTFIASWYALGKRGVTRLSGLDENYNMEYTSRPMSEQASEDGFINDLVGFDSSEGTWETRMTSNKIDQDSIDKYGLRQGSFNHTIGHNQSASNRKTQNMLNRTKNPVLVHNLTALDIGNTFYNLRIGDILPIKYTSIGINGDGGWGIMTSARITGMTYDDISNKVKLTFDEDNGAEEMEEESA